ncbi:hypothetical protein GCM10012276_05980 [Nocardioides deserti]|nr:hypothetical protein GCM10012276_05980 [Nocardioides deserti]
MSGAGVDAPGVDAPGGSGLRVVLCPDSFKESLTAPVVAAAMRRGVARVWPAAGVVEVPLADGGEGTVEALARATGGELVTRRVRGPSGRSVDATYPARRRQDRGGRDRRGVRPAPGATRAPRPGARNDVRHR